MPVQRKTLSVLPNPWTHIDEKGRPAGAVIVEQPNNGTFDRRWVGATFAAKEVQAAKRVTVAGRSFEQTPAIHEHEWDHVSEPVTVANTAYYRKCVLKGDLIAADELTAIACGIAKNDFAKPEELFERIKQEAIAEFDARNGEGAFEALAEMRDEDEERAAEVAAAVAGAAGERREPDAKLQGVTLPADGALHEVKLESTAGQPLPPMETDSNGVAVLVEREAPALPDSESRASKRAKGSDQ